MSRTDNPDAPYADMRPSNPQAIKANARVISLSDVHRARTVRCSDRVGSETNGADPTSASGWPAAGKGLFGSATDMDTIAAEPSFAVRRRRLAEAMAAISGESPSDRTLDHRMIATGVAAGHGCGELDSDKADRWPLGSTMDDPAVVVGLVLHHARHGAARGLPMPASVKHALDRHVASGNAAARLVRDWWRVRSAPPERRRLQVFEGGKA